jgi:hypothetical protein
MSPPKIGKLVVSEGLNKGELCELTPLNFCMFHSCVEWTQQNRKQPRGSYNFLNNILFRHRLGRNLFEILTLAVIVQIPVDGRNSRRFGTIDNGLGFLIRRKKNICRGVFDSGWQLISWYDVCLE